MSNTDPHLESSAADPRASILLIEDDAETARLIERRLLAAGYAVTVAHDGIDGLTAAFGLRPDALVLDRSLPCCDGLVVLRQLRGAGATMPALILSARASVQDRIDGLDAGADDYLVKPFALAELLARIKVMLRRAGQTQDVHQLCAGPVTLDLLRREVRRDGVTILLQPKEARLLEELMRNAGTFVTRALLLERVWNFQFDPNTKIVETHISRLRTKLNAVGPDLIETRRALGYRIRP